MYQTDALYCTNGIKITNNMFLTIKKIGVDFNGAFLWTLAELVIVDFSGGNFVAFSGNFVDFSGVVDFSGNLLWTLAVLWTLEELWTLTVPQCCNNIKIKGKQENSTS